MCVWPLFCWKPKFQLLIWGGWRIWRQAFFIIPSPSCSLPVPLTEHVATTTMFDNQDAILWFEGLTFTAPNIWSHLNIKHFFQEAANPVELESVDFGADSSFSFSTLSAHRGLVSSGLQAWALLVCELLPNSQTNFLSCENNSLGLLPELGKRWHIWITCLCTTVWTNLCKPTVLLLRSLPSSLDFHIVLSQSSGCYERNAFYGNSKGKPALVDHDQQQELNRPGSCQVTRRCIFSTIY